MDEGMVQEDIAEENFEILDQCFKNKPDDHIEYEYYSAPDHAEQVGWKVFTCTCNVYSSGEVTPYYTVLSSPCP